VAIAVGAVFAAWNALLIANLTYVERGDHDPGYGGLVAGQVEALRHVPNLLAQGAAGRDLLWWPVLHRPFAPLEGLVLLTCEVLVLALAGFVAWWRPANLRSVR
jgi:hypothetical protein